MLYLQISEASNDEIEAVELSDGDEPDDEESEEEHLMLRDNRTALSIPNSRGLGH